MKRSTAATTAAASSGETFGAMSESLGRRFTGWRVAGQGARGAGAGRGLAAGRPPLAREPSCVFIVCEVVVKLRSGSSAIFAPPARKFGSRDRSSLAAGRVSRTRAVLRRCPRTTSRRRAREAGAGAAPTRDGRRRTVPAARRTVPAARRAEPANRRDARARREPGRENDRIGRCRAQGPRIRDSRRPQGHHDSHPDPP
jgi:hypothetical protein